MSRVSIFPKFEFSTESPKSKNGKKTDNVLSVCFRSNGVRVRFRECKFIRTSLMKSQLSRTFLDTLRRFRTLSDTLGGTRMHSDALACPRTAISGMQIQRDVPYEIKSFSDVLGRPRTPSDAFGFPRAQSREFGCSRMPSEGVSAVVRLSVHHLGTIPHHWTRSAALTVRPRRYYRLHYSSIIESRQSQKL